MKRKFTTVLLALSAIVMLFATSCTREYNCQCKFTYTGAPGLPEGVVKEYKIRDTKSAAQSACQGSSKEYDKDGIHTVEDCDLF